MKGAAERHVDDVNLTLLQTVHSLLVGGPTDPNHRYLSATVRYQDIYEENATFSQKPQYPNNIPPPG